MPEIEWTLAGTSGMLETSGRTPEGIAGDLPAPNEENHCMLRSSVQRTPRWLDVIPVRASAVDARGPALWGPTAIGALAVGATALGAVAIGRLAIGRAVIKRLVIEDLEVGRLRVREFEVENERRPQPS